MRLLRWFKKRRAPFRPTSGKDHWGAWYDDGEYAAWVCSRCRWGTAGPSGGSGALGWIAARSNHIINCH